VKQQAAVGFEPTDNGFANRPLRPLGYAASLKTSLILPPITTFYNKNTPENQEIFLQHFYRINVYTNRKINGDGALFWTLLARKLLNLRVLLKPLV
jgi:hypothetical protein